MAVVVDSKRKLTYADYLKLPNEDLRHEIIDGEHHVSASPNLNHQRVSSHLQFQLFQQITLSGRGEVFPAPTDVQLSEFDVVVPDLVVVLNARSGYLTEAKVSGPPDLVVEILSPGSRRRDRELKRSLYQRTGVDEYWIVDPVARQVEKYRRRGKLLAAAGVFTERISFDGLDDVVVDLAGVW